MKQPIHDTIHDEYLQDRFIFQKRGMCTLSDGSVQFIIYAWKNEEFAAGLREPDHDYFMSNEFCPFNEKNFFKFKFKGVPLKGTIKTIVRDYYSTCIILYVNVKGVQAKKVIGIL